MSQREFEVQERPARVIFLGMQSNFSHPSLRALLAAGIEVCAVVMPGAQSQQDGPALRRLEPPSRRRVFLTVNHSFLHTSVQQIAWERSIPLWEVTRLDDPAVTELFTTLKPDLICVACFSRFIPPSLLAIPRLGALNVHPSFLPDNRGPEPLFCSFGLAQETLEIPEGITYAELEQKAAELGSVLLVQAVTNLMRGQVHPRPQDESQSH